MDAKVDGTGGDGYKICEDGWGGCNFCPGAGLYTAVG